ncbi:MAG: hypothetical protein LQ338_002325 [Usnochroma carphineum]|nr:MAG: hypothetical protein LQ338_002325 [Usnochroma carphineum]
MKATTTVPRLYNAISTPPHPILRHPLVIRTPTSTQRPFVSSSTLTPLQTLTASRILPYPSSALYNLITDIPSYPSFLPYCSSSRITSTSSPDPTYKKQWPRTADLQVGWGGYNESYRSRIYCLPYQIIEACAGSAEPTIPKSQLPHYSDASSAESTKDDIQDNPLFTSLLTRWNLHEFPFKPLPPEGGLQDGSTGSAEANPAHPRTEISLVIEARFASAVYSALSQAAAPKVAGMMIDAFEKRAQEVLGKGHGVEGRGEGENKGEKLPTEGVVGEEGKRSE